MHTVALVWPIIQISKVWTSRSVGSSLGSRRLLKWIGSIQYKAARQTTPHPARWQRLSALAELVLNPSKRAVEHYQVQRHIDAVYSEHHTKLTTFRKTDQACHTTSRTPPIPFDLFGQGSSISNSELCYTMFGFGILYQGATIDPPLVSAIKSNCPSAEATRSQQQDHPSLPDHPNSAAFFRE